MASPASSAHALHDLIARVNSRIGHAERSAYNSWQVVSGLQHDSPDFARFHAEVMALFGEVAEGVQALSPPQQERYAQYLPQWWAAIVQPRMDWATDNKKIIEPAPLNMLGALADLLEARAPLGGPSNPHATDILMKAVAMLLGEVEAETTLLPTVRDQIVADLKHVLWLLEHVGTFGVEHAVAATERVIGKAVAEATKSPSQVLKKIAVGLTAALAMTASNTTSVETIAANVRTTFGITSGASGHVGEDMVQNTVVQIYNVCTTKELLPGTVAGDDEPVDAEIVKEGEGQGPPR
jgi:hypothetical protein